MKKHKFCRTTSETKSISGHAPLKCINVREAGFIYDKHSLVPICTFSNMGTNIYLICCNKKCKSTIFTENSDWRESIVQNTWSRQHDRHVTLIGPPIMT